MTYNIIVEWAKWRNFDPDDYIMEDIESFEIADRIYNELKDVELVQNIKMTETSVIKSRL